ncbi:response regulator transcription factor (plasmid) [Deinococcus radiomollis]|uniref:response regulator transcription factor n=1 Tax=Deinococcus radiomollis TaxID=468916 RepID=UPI0038919305
MRALTRKTVLVIDSDRASAELMYTSLREAGYDVLLTRSVMQGLILARETRPALVITELSLQDGSGADVVTRLTPSGIPVLVVSARGDVTSKVTLLGSGAADYLVKPFEVREFLARVTTQLRDRRVEAGWEELVAGELVLDVQRRLVRVRGWEVRLTERERDVLEALMREPERVFTHRELQERVWGAEAAGTNAKRNNLAVMMANIRTKLNATGADGYLVTIRGTGYALR